MSTLAAHDVCVRAGARELVCAVDLELEAGFVTALIGPSGAGKTTLLRAFAGDVVLARGRVELGGRAIEASALRRHARDAWPREELARTRAVVEQNAPAVLGLTALELVSLGRLPHGERSDGHAAREAARRALRDVGLEARAHQRTEQLSGGELQRVHFARALAQLGDDVRGRWLLLDEPTSGLDPAHATHVLSLATRLAERGAGVLLVLHDLNAAAQCADRLVALRDGRVIASGPTQSVLDARLLARLFGLETTVVPHPCNARPVVLPVARATAHVAQREPTTTHRHVQRVTANLAHEPHASHFDARARRVDHERLDPLETTT